MTVQVIKFWKDTYTAFTARWRTLVGFQFAYGLAATLAFSPLVHLLLKELVRASGDAAITNYDLAEFFLSAKGVAFLVLGGLAGLLSWRLQQSALVLLTADPDAEPLTALRDVWRRIWSVLVLTLAQLAAIIVLLIPLGLTVYLVWRFLLGDQDINFYTHVKPPRWYAGLTLVAVAGLATVVTAIGLLTRWAFALPLVLRFAIPVDEALRRSFQYTRRNWVLPLATVGGFWLLVWGVSNLFSLSAIGLGRLALLGTGDHVGLAVLIVLLVFGSMGTVGLATGAVGPIFQAGLVNGLLDAASGISAVHPPAVEAKNRRALRRATAAIVLFALAGLTVGLTAWLQRLDFSIPIQITAHRGSSAAAPENTLSALRQALKDGADFAEIDVQTTKDGEVVLLHDRDLMRMGRDPRPLTTLTLKDLQKIDVGSPFGEAFKGERVPTLRDALKWARGKMGLNIELKYNVPDPTLAPRVIGLLRETAMLDQCVVTSLDLEALRQAENLEPRLVTGLIVTKALGDPTALGVDFLSVNVEAADRRLIRRARRKGLAVHVWTVNDAATFERMADRGVDFVISDHPAELSAFRRARAALTKTELIALRLRRLLVW